MIKKAFLIAALTSLSCLFQPSIGMAADDHGGYRPHYQGFGTDTPGGRGGVVCKVNTLNDSWPGQGQQIGSGEYRGNFRYCVEVLSVPRIVLFEVSGTIALTNGPVIATHPFMTIAGQTAPSPGINIRNYGLLIDTHDVVVQHLRMRHGDTHDGIGAFPTLGIREIASEGKFAYNVVIDHMSVAWAMYMGFGSYSPLQGHMHSISDYSVLDSIFAFGLNKEGVNPSYTGMGVAVGRGNLSSGTDPGATLARNLLVHNSHRQPLGIGQVVNNVIYGTGPGMVTGGYFFAGYWPNSCGTGGAVDTVTRSLLYTNNVFVPSTGTPRGSVGDERPILLIANQTNLNSGSKLWLRGNQGPFITGSGEAGQWTGVWPDTVGYCVGGQFQSVNDVNTLKAAYAPAVEPSWHTNMNFSTIATDTVFAYLSANAGARPVERDYVDQAAVSQAQAGLVRDTAQMGSRIRSQNEMGGHPVMTQNVRVLQIPANPNAVAPGQSFRTNIEMWLENYARALEPGSSGTPPPPPPPTEPPPTTPPPTEPPPPTSPTQITLTASATSVVPNAPLSVSWTALSGSSIYDWIAISPVGSAETVYDFDNWVYTNGVASGTFNTTAPGTAGSYEFRYMLDNGFTIARRSAAIHVSSTPAPPPTTDTTPPLINSWDVQARSGSTSSRTVSWNVSDSGGALSKVDIYRATFSGSSCSSTSISGCAWAVIQTVNAPAGSKSWTSSASVSQPSGSHWYGLHVLDQAGNRTTQGGNTITVQNSALSTPPPPSAGLFSDSFEVGEWNSLWTEDSQNDWFRSSQRAQEGSRSAEVDGSADRATLTSIPINLQGKTSATVSFKWFIESGLDSGEYVSFEVSTNGGSTWSEKKRISGNVNPENVWQSASVNLSGINNLRIRFRAKISSSDEDANVDLVNVV